MKFLSEDKVYRILADAELPVLKHRVFRRSDRIDRDLFPAVVKPIFRKPVHKTEMGAVLECSSKKSFSMFNLKVCF